MRMKTIAIIALSVATISAAAQEHLTQKDYRQKVVSYSMQLKMSAENTIAATEKLKMVNTGYLPSLSVAANGNYTVGNNISFGAMMLKDYNYSSNLSLQQKVYAGHSVRNQSLAAGIEKNIAQLGEKDATQNVIYSADMAYLAVAASSSQLKVSQQYTFIVKSLYDVVQIRFDDGYVSRTDLLMVQTRLNEARLQEIAARKLYLNSVERLNSLMGQYTSEQYTTDSLMGAKYIVPQNAQLEFALENRPDFLSSKLKVDLANQNIRVARSKYNPQFMVGVQGVFGTPSLNFTGDPKLYGAAYAQFSAPIFMWGERRRSVGMVKASARAAQYSMQDQQDQINRELKTAHINLEQSFEQSQVAEQNLSIASDNLELNTFSYSEGKLPILDVLQSQIAWIQSYTAMVNSIYNYRVAVTDFEKALGIISL